MVLLTWKVCPLLGVLDDMILFFLSLNPALLASAWQLIARHAVRASA
jgi:hypothetical protein